ncbi:MAG: 2OG-Fe(II) oxygenase [Acidimicrobiales bacterium]
MEAPWTAAPPDAGAPFPISASWLARASSLRSDFERAEPFPLLVLDEFLDPSFAADLLAEFPSMDLMPRSQDYLFGRKHELSSVEQAGTAGARFYQAMTSKTFASFLSEVTGWDLFVDPAFHGGGFHQGGDGSFLDMHVDFNLHPLNRTWLRMLNILLYMNQDWEESWGGHLMVKSGVDAPTRAIAPTFNRAVIMMTAGNTYHGYRRMSLPPGVTRKSIATYAYREIQEGSAAYRTTGWVPEGAALPKRLVARHYNTLVRLKNRWFGSGTARNR